MMKNMHKNILDIDWLTITEVMNEKGYTLVTNSYLFSPAMNLLTNTTTPIYIARPLRWKGMVSD
jgi:hypothetical protein